MLESNEGGESAEHTLGVCQFNHGDWSDGASNNTHPRYGNQPECPSRTDI